MAITFVPLYPNAVAPDKIIENLITLLSDPTYQAGALAHYAVSGETLSPYVLISESAVWREDMATPALLIKDVTTEAETEGEDGPLLRQTHRFSVYQCLALQNDHEALMREAYRRNLAVDMMIRSAHKSGFNLFEGTGTNPDSVLIQVRRRHYGDTVTGQALYRRFPSVDVEIPAIDFR
jgi:hypothetical protein